MLATRAKKRMTITPTMMCQGRTQPKLETSGDADVWRSSIWRIIWRYWMTLESVRDARGTARAPLGAVGGRV